MSTDPPANGYTFIDLFCGCGGFTLGMQRAGFECLAALDFNKEAIQVFQNNFPAIPHALEKDLNEFTPCDLEALVGTQPVDVVVGGPPCQGFSQARQRDGANHGPRIVEDPRRGLYVRFLAFVQHFQPKVFVMENVLGIRSVGGGEYFTRVQAEGRRLGYRVVPREEIATNLGVPQNRRRQLFIGIRQDVPGYLSGELSPPPRAAHWVGVTLGDAIMDLPKVEAGGGAQEMGYDMCLRSAHVNGDRHHYLYKVLEVNKATKLTGHDSRPHSARDLRDFAKLREGENCKQAMLKRGVEFEFPYDRERFKDRYTRQSRSRPCSTIVAHMSKDGLMFIHPTQLRSLTPREAARVQTFPDWFQFPVTRTHQYRMIGNAVPPVVAEAVGMAVANLLSSATQTDATTITSTSGNRSLSIPANDDEALVRITEVAAHTRPELRVVDDASFLKCWHALLFLCPELHPDNAIDHGDKTEFSTKASTERVNLGERYSRSGWPVILEPFGREAWRRFKAGRINEQQFYCLAPQKAGLAARKVAVNPVALKDAAS